MADLVNNRGTNPSRRRALVVLLIATSCATPSPPGPSATAPWVVGQFEARYQARLGPGTFAPRAADDRDAARSDDRLIRFECDILAVPPDVAARFFDFGPRGAAGLTLATSQVEPFVEELLATPGVDRLQSPRVMAQAGQSACIEVLQRTSYIHHFDFESSRDHLVADPEVGSVEHGLQLDLCATGGAERPREVRAAFVITEVQHPVAASGSVPFEGTAEVTVQHPLLWSQRLSTSASVGTAETLVLGRLLHKESGRVLITLITPREVPPPGSPDS